MTFNNKIDILKGAFFPLLLNTNLVNIDKVKYLAFLVINKIVIKIIIFKAINRLKKDKILKFNKIFNKFLLIIATLFIRVFIYLF